MSQLITEKLLEASYKGAQFFFQEISTTGGRKISTAELVNSDNRIVEDLGLLNDIISMAGITSGNDFSARDRLIAALKSPGSGQLSHPTRGLITVTADVFTTVDSLDNLGITTFDMTFIVAKDVVIVPRRSGVSPSEINNKAESLLDKILDFFGREYSISDQFPLNFLDGVDKSKQITEKFTETALRFKSVSTGSSNELFRLLGDADTNRLAFLTDSQSYAGLIGGLFRAIDDTGGTGGERSNIARSFSDFGDTDALISPTTQQLSERLRNRELVNDTMKAAGLAQSYRASPLVDFLTVNDIEDERNQLDGQYFDVIDSDVLSDDVKNSINDLRNTNRIFLDNESETTFNLTTFNTKTTAITPLVYAHYGDVDLLDDIININNLTDISFVDGDLELLTK